MNLRELRYLVAISECRSFSRAAERCAVTQSTLSIQLRKLEDYLGVPLIDRDRSRVALTAEGEEVLRLARIAVQAADEIIRFGRHRSRRLRARGTQAPQADGSLIDDINYLRTPRK